MVLLGRTSALLAGAAVLLCLQPALPRAQPLQSYTLDQRFGSIRFSVGHLGLFSSEGEFRRFEAHLQLDTAHPEKTRIEVDVKATSVDMSWPEGADMLRSADFFDVQRFPDLRFNSTEVVPVANDRYVLRGRLEMRGVTQPLTLMARLVQQHVDAAHREQLADFVVTGALSRSEFGMTADRTFISDRVGIVITAHLKLPVANAG